jgi:phage tail-like protein
VTITAVADPVGNQVTVSWTGTAGTRYQLWARRGTHPTPGPGGWVGELVADTDTHAAADRRPETTPDGFQIRHRGLVAEVVQYYQLLTAGPGDPPAWTRPADRTAAMATGPYLFAERLYQLLPAVFRRFDTAAAPDDVADQLPDTLRGQGQLRRLLELVGEELDQLYSTIRSLADLTDVQTVDGRLLPLLAHWVGWRINHGLELAEQRRQIADAATVYQAIQTVAALEAAARRVTGWPCKAKELVDNVAYTNRPERLNLWEVPASPKDEPVLRSVDEVGEGRAAVVRQGATVRLVYATTRSGTSELWETVRGEHGDWTPGMPLVTGPDAYLQPAAAAVGDTALLFWSAYSPDSGWRIEYRALDADGWGPVRGLGAPDAQRRDPAVAVEGTGATAALWLFWRELGPDGRWRLRYQRRTGPTWEPGPDGIHDFPSEQAGDPRVEASPSAAVGQGVLWLWWARRTAVAGGSTRWRVAMRTKTTLDDDTAGWGEVTELPADPAVHDREPTGQAEADGVSVLFSSTRDGSWSVFQVGVDAQAHTWGTPTAVTTEEFTDRSPVAIPARAADHPTPGDTAAVLYRSSRSITYPSTRYRAAVTVDRRYSGTVTVQATNQARLKLGGKVDDVLTYTCSARPLTAVVSKDPAPIAADVVVLHMRPPPSADQAGIDAGVARLIAVLPDFLPATIRARIVIERPSA